jgi:hypothetical protein
MWSSICLILSLLICCVTAQYRRLMCNQFVPIESSKFFCVARQFSLFPTSLTLVCLIFLKAGDGWSATGTVLVTQFDTQMVQ